MANSPRWPSAYNISIHQRTAHKASAIPEVGRDLPPGGHPAAPALLPGLEAYRPRIRYLLLDEQHYDEQELAGIPGLAQALFRLERSRTPEAMNEVVGILADALKGPAHAELQRAFLVFLLQGLLPARLPGVELTAMSDLSEVHAMLSERVKKWTEQWKQQRIEQGLAAGRRREAGLVPRLLQRRIGLIPAALTEQIQNLPLERIEPAILNAW